MAGEPKRDILNDSNQLKSRLLIKLRLTLSRFKRSHSAGAWWCASFERVCERVFSWQYLLVITSGTWIG